MDREFLIYAKDRIKNHPDLSQAELAEQLGVNGGTVSRILSGNLDNYRKYLPGIRRYLTKAASIDETAIALIDEIEVRDQGSFDDARVIRQWALPLQLFELPGERRKIESHIKAVPVTDNTNSPFYKSGDYVFVYTKDRKATMGGAYMLWDGRSSFIIRKCETVPDTDPPKIRLKPLNPQYDTHEITYNEDIFVGRIVGHFRKPETP